MWRGKKNIGKRGRFANTLYMGKISSNLLYLHHGDEGVFALGQGKRDKKGLDQNAVFLLSQEQWGCYFIISSKCGGPGLKR